MSDQATDGVELLREARVILLIDWPDRDVPDTLARGGFTVISDEGPGRGYTAYEVSGAVVTRRSDAEAPARADIVYAHRPVEELPDIVERARAMDARAVWLQSGFGEDGNRDWRGCWQPPDESQRAREMVESARLIYVEQPYIADVARSLSQRETA